MREGRWRARLGILTEKYLKKLFKRRVLVSALDMLLPIKGLWKHFQPGSMDIVLSIRCDEVTLAADQGEMALLINFLRKSLTILP